MKPLEGRHILLGISGGIAAYKSAFLCRRLKEAGADVWVSMTPNGARFITPLTMETLSEREVLIEMFPVERFVGTRHIDIAKWADLFLIAPATANLIGRYANGLADDLLATLLISTTAPVMLAPAMNTEMWFNAAVQENLRKLRERGVLFVEPGVGELACHTVGVGRMAEPEEIMEAVVSHFNAQRNRDLLGLTVLVTAGPTQEPLDPVRVITNHSSGRMGYAVAQAAAARGAKVILVSGPTALPKPPVSSFVSVQTSEQMREAVVNRFDSCDIVIGVAAVSDWRAVEPSAQKLSKDSGTPHLELEATPDILAELGRRKKNQILVGFSLETDPQRLASRDKLEKKNLDLLVANNPTQPGSEFGGDTNDAQIINRDGAVERLGLLPKLELAHAILDRIIAIRAQSPSRTPRV
jgi:phosphopantothenoylcysteine decarboxylase/phosphopantothenate--cysteine ligase